MSDLKLTFFELDANLGTVLRGKLAVLLGVRSADLTNLMAVETFDQLREERSVLKSQVENADIHFEQVRMNGENRIAELEAQLDLNRDEFLRIKNLARQQIGFRCVFAGEIEGLCERSQQVIRQRVPLIRQLDAANLREACVSKAHSDLVADLAEAVGLPNKAQDEMLDRVRMLVAHYDKTAGIKSPTCPTCHEPLTLECGPTGDQSNMICQPCLEKDAAVDFVKGFTKYVSGCEQNAFAAHGCLDRLRKSIREGHAKSEGAEAALRAADEAEELRIATAWREGFLVQCRSTDAEDSPEWSDMAAYDINVSTTFDFQKWQYRVPDGQFAEMRKRWVMEVDCARKYADQLHACESERTELQAILDRSREVHADFMAAKNARIEDLIKSRDSWTATVSEDCPPDALKAIDQMAQLAAHAMRGGKLVPDADPSLPSAGARFLSFAAEIQRIANERDSTLGDMRAALNHALENADLL